MREREMKSCNNLRKTFPRKKRVISFDKTIVPHEQRGVSVCHCLFAIQPIQIEETRKKIWKWNFDIHGMSKPPAELLMWFSLDWSANSVIIKNLKINQKINDVIMCGPWATPISTFF